jgi:superoxide dismutase, Fe-Mn family
MIDYMFTLPTLKFEMNALEPVISAKTLEFHYGKHHAGYVNKLNELLADLPELLVMSIEELVANLDRVPEGIRGAVTNNAGQVYNHNLYWESMTGEPKFSDNADFNKALDGFGSYENFEKLWSEAGMGQFGSGWVWLVVDKDGKLSIEKSGNADSPLMHGRKPIMTMDVWEHAYYLDFQNRRADYIKGFLGLVDWVEVGNKYAKALA